MDKQSNTWLQKNGERLELTIELVIATIIAIMIASSASTMEAKIFYFARVEITLFLLIIPFWHVRHDILPHIAEKNDQKGNEAIRIKFQKYGTLISIIIGCIIACIFSFVCYLYVGTVGIAVGIGFGLKEYVAWKMYFTSQEKRA